MNTLIALLLAASSTAAFAQAQAPATAASAPQVKQQLSYESVEAICKTFALTPLACTQLHDKLAQPQATAMKE